MKSILEFLFACELSFPKRWKEENRLGLKIEKAHQLASQLEEKQPQLWHEYWEQEKELQTWQCQFEFERGFVMAATLFIEVINRNQSES